MINVKTWSGALAIGAIVLRVVHKYMLYAFIYMLNVYLLQR